jgi:RNA polymerase sigma factor (sigma-70 family)
MHETDDHDLLRQYAQHHSEAAFAALVTRHVDKVYSAALRHTRNAHAAEETTQAVFVILAKKSGRLGAKVILSGWLYETARLTALTYIRSEIRRARREQEAHMQTALNSSSDASSPSGQDTAWPHIAPLLDDALAGLSVADRHAVVLRYFDGKSLGEVGAALGASEDAAKKRVTRAVEKLRGWFTKRGVTLTARVLTAAISANSVQAAPLGLAATVTATAAKGAVVSGSTLTLIKGALKIMAWTKAKTAIVVGVGAVLVGTGVYQAQQVAKLREQNQALQQQQAPLAEEIQQLQNDFANATNRLAKSLADKTRQNQDTGELLRLRGEVTRLKSALKDLAQLNAENDSQSGSDGGTNAYISTLPLSQRIHHIQTYLVDHPEEGIPEIQFASPVKWLNSIQGPIGSGEQLSNALMLLRRQAMSGFMSEIRMAELEFEKANSGRFPDALAQLLPLLDSAKGQVLLENYEIVPAKTINDPNAKITGDWVIVRKARVNPNSNTSMERLAAYAGGQSAWYHSDTRDGN